MGGNLTGINFLTAELAAKRLELLQALNIAFTEVRRLRPDLFLPNFVIPHFQYTEVEPPPVKTTPVPFEPMYRMALVYYMVGHAQLRDDESTTDARAASLLTKFAAQMLTIQS